MIKYISNNPDTSFKQFQRADWQSRFDFAVIKLNEIKSRIDNHNKAILDGFGGDEIEGIVNCLRSKKINLLDDMANYINKIEVLDCQINPRLRREMC